jgi:hypothetical protein
MNCTKVEKWLSDRIDGALSERKTRAIEAHLEKCAACRSYAASLEKIHEEILHLEREEASPAFWEGFAQRLKANLGSAREMKNRRPFVRGWNWVWSGAALLAVVLVGLYLLLFQNPQPQEMVVFSLENSLTRIYQEIGDDSELEELFNSILVESINEYLEDSEWRERPEFLNNLLFWENLTEEELKFLESEIKKDITS